MLTARPAGGAEILAVGERVVAHDPIVCFVKKNGVKCIKKVTAKGSDPARELLEGICGQCGLGAIQCQLHSAAF